MKKIKRRISFNEKKSYLIFKNNNLNLLYKEISLRKQVNVLTFNVNLKIPRIF